MQPLTSKILSWVGYLIPVGLLCTGAFFLGMIAGTQKQRADGPASLSAIEDGPFELTYDDLVRRVAASEVESPMHFLELKEFEVSSRFLSGSKDVDCVVFNKAFAVVFRRLQVEIGCYSESGDLLGTLYEQLKGKIHSRTVDKLSVRIDPPGGTDRCTVRLVDAEPDR